MKQKKVNIRKLILGLSTVGLLALTTTTSTYAWFKINSTAAVQGFDFEVIGGKGFMVSVDGGTYTNDLSLDKLKKAMVVSYSNGKYALGYETDDNGAITESDVLYKISYDSDGKEVKTKVEDLNSVYSETIDLIQLLQTTSFDGRNLTDLYKSTVTPGSGRYVEFGVYFKTTSTNSKDNLHYDIYLDGYGGKDNDGNKVEATKFTSVTTKVKLNASMNAVLYKDDGSKYLPYTPGETHEPTYKSGETISVYSSNAARISTTVSNKVIEEATYVLTSDTNVIEGKEYYVNNEGVYTLADVIVGDVIPDGTYYEFKDETYSYVVDESSTLIYELNDTEHLNTDLGSYATDYDENTEGYNLDDYYLYSSECNAMYTYYNKLRRSSQIKSLDYDELPKTIKSLPNVSSDDKSLEYDKIVTVSSGEDAKLVTFRIWLEGWDADCFDGLADSIDVRLTFGSKRVSN